MIDNFLLDSLAAFCGETLKDLIQAVPQRQGEPLPGALQTRAVLSARQNAEQGAQTASEALSEGGFKIFRGWVPPGRGRDRDAYPYVAVLPVQGEIDYRKAVTFINVQLGVWNPDALTALNDLHNAMTRLSLGLMSLPAGTLAGKYMLEPPLDWDLPPEQPQPFYEALLSVHFSHASPWLLPGGDLI